MNTHPKYITPEWLYRFVGIHPRTLSWWIQRKHAPVITRNSQKVFESTAFLAWFRSLASESTRGPFGAKRQRWLRALEKELASPPDATLIAQPAAESLAPPAAQSPEASPSFLELCLNRRETFSLIAALRDHLDFTLDSAPNDGVDPMRATRIRDIVRVLSRIHTACLQKANMLP